VVVGVVGVEVAVAAGLAARFVAGLVAVVAVVAFLVEAFFAAVLATGLAFLPNSFFKNLNILSSFYFL
jgi:uncharacterized membrane protein YphA (DoxX/SURF4 family)